MSSGDNKNVTNPGPNDILCGRGGGTNAHPGNIKFRKLVAAHKLRYLAASKSDKPGVARDVVREWRAMDPPGRFLAKLDKNKLPEGGGGGGDGGDDNLTVWYDVGDKKAREKASQCLRERNGAANEAVAALVKTVTASGEACPEDYATLMNKAAKVKAQNDLTIQRQNEMIKMNNMGGMGSPGMGGPGMGGPGMGGPGMGGPGMGGLGMGGPGMGGPGMGGPGMDGGGGNNFCQEPFEPISLQQQRFPPGSNFSGNNMNNAAIKSEDDIIEAEIQRLLKQRQQLMANGPGYNNRGDGGMNRMGGGGMGGGMNPAGGGNMPQAGGTQPYMGEENVMREYEQLMQKQRELNMMAGKLDGMGGGGGGGGGMNSPMGGLINTFNSNVMNSHMMSQASSNMLNPNMNNMMNSPMGGNNNNYGGQGMSGPMQSGHNPDAAKDYMNRLRSMRQGGGSGSGNGIGIPDQATSSVKLEGYNNDGYSGHSGNGIMGNNNGGGNSNNMMNNMGGNMQQQMQGNNVKSEVQGGRGPDQFTIQEYQASLQQFLSHNDDLGGTSIKNENTDQISREMSQQTQQAGNLGITMQVPTNLGDGNNNVRNKGDRRRSVDDMDLPVPLNRNTFKSVDSADRPSFQSMDDMDIRGTFKSVDDMDIRGTFQSVDTMDLMSIGNSINEIIEDDVKQNPESRKKYGRMMSNASSRGGFRKKAAGAGASGPPSGAGASLNNFAHLPGQTLEIKTLDHGQARPSGGPRKMKKGIDPRLVAHAKGMMTRHSVQTKDNDGPSGGGRGSMLSIKDLNLEGVDDASRMSFGNMSVMSELTDFQEMMARGQDSFAQR